MYERLHFPSPAGKTDVTSNFPKEQRTAHQDNTAMQRFKQASSSTNTRTVIKEQYLLAHPNPLICPASGLAARPPKRSPTSLTQLPLTIISEILRYILIPDPSRPQILPVTFEEAVVFGKTVHDLPILHTCRILRDVGRPLFFEQNTFTTSSPSATSELFRGTRALPSEQRRLITKISLQIDWADELWVHFPLVGAALSMLVRLRRLEIFLVQKVTGGDGRLTWDGTSSAEIREVKRRESRGLKREGVMAQLMLKAEKKMFAEVVLGLKTLQVFRLSGFADVEFAVRLERTVSRRGALRLGGGPDG